MTARASPVTPGTWPSRGGTIREVGGKAGPARREVDGDGLVAAPGFVDGHTHMDAQLLWDPQVTSSCYHGVTSIVTGNCGLSLAPCKPEDRDILLQTFSHVEGMDIGLLRRAVEWSWTDMAGYMNAVEAMRPALNVGMLVGHCPLRQYVMGEDAIKRAATADEVAAMQALLREALQAGLLGFSTNRNERHFREDGEPLPSRLAEWDELEALGQVLADLKRGVIQMSSASQNAARVASLADFSLRTGRPVVWNAILHRWARPDEWRELLDATVKGFERGAQAWANTNVRPFNNRFNLIDGQEFDEFPVWRGLMFSPIEERRAAFQDPEVRKKLRWEVVEDSAPAAFHRRWELVYIVKPATEKNAHLKGANVADYARSQGKDVFDAFMDLCLEEDLATGFQTAHTNGDADAVGTIVSSPYTVLGQSTPAPTWPSTRASATAPCCWPSTCGSAATSASKRGSASSPPCRPTSAASPTVAGSSPAWPPTWWCSTPPPWRRGNPSSCTTSPAAPPAWSSTPTASTPSSSTARWHWRTARPPASARGRCCGTGCEGEPPLSASLGLRHGGDH